MAGQLPSFLTGNSVIIRIGERNIAYAQNLNIASRMDNQAVYSVGSASPMALEPVMHGCSFSMNIVRYSTALVAGNGASIDDKTGISSGGTIAGREQAQLPDNIQPLHSLEAGLDGNSILDRTSFNPQLLLLSQTFDIAVYEQSFEYDNAGVKTQKQGNLLMLLKDCRLQNYSFNFAPGELLIESVSGIARFLTDATAEVK